jgi:hypothetical protein
VGVKEGGWREVHLPAPRRTAFSLALSPSRSLSHTLSLLFTHTLSLPLSLSIYPSRAHTRTLSLSLNHAITHKRQTQAAGLALDLTRVQSGGAAGLLSEGDEMYAWLLVRVREPGSVDLLMYQAGHAGPGMEWFAAEVSPRVGPINSEILARE